jgi:hypothetical protein
VSSRFGQKIAQIIALKKELFSKEVFVKQCEYLAKKKSKQRPH